MKSRWNPQARARKLAPAWFPGVSLALLLLSLLFCGCGRSVKVPPADFTFVNGAEPETLDPHTVVGQPDIRIAQELFEGLTARNGKGEIVPGIAERWELSPDRRVYTFHLRDAVWSNGAPLTARDFLASWKRALDPKTASEYAYQYFYIVNAEAYSEGKMADFNRVGVEAPDDRTFRVTLSAPTPFFLDLCATTTMAPVYLPALQRWGDDWIKPGKMVNDGAYLLADWRINDRVSLLKNPRYWNAKAVSFNRIDALALTAATTAFNLFHSGMADLILDKSMVPTFFVDALRTKPYFHAETVFGTYFYRFNVTRKPFDDPRVRQALALALDKRRVVERITRGGETVAATFAPPGIAGYEPPAGLGYDPEKARALLAAAGYPGGKGFPPVSILYNSSEQDAQISTEIQAIWRENLGIDVGLRKQEWKAYLNSLTTLDYELGRSSWVADYPDPNTFLDCFVSGRGNNRTGWASPAYDALIGKAGTEPDPVRRLGVFREAETLLIDRDAVVIPIYYYITISIYRSDRLGGFSPNALDQHPLHELYWLSVSGSEAGGAR